MLQASQSRPGAAWRAWERAHHAEGEGVAVGGELLAGNDLGGLPARIVGHQGVGQALSVHKARQVEVRDLHAPEGITHEIWGLDIRVDYLGAVLVQLEEALAAAQASFESGR